MQAIGAVIVFLSIDMDDEKPEKGHLLIDRNPDKDDTRHLRGEGGL
jgi:hypothetical protein